MDAKKKAIATLLEGLGKSGALLRKQRLMGRLPKAPPEPDAEKKVEDVAAVENLDEVYAHLNN